MQALARLAVERQKLLTDNPGPALAVVCSADLQVCQVIKLEHRRSGDLHHRLEMSPRRLCDAGARCLGAASPRWGAKSSLTCAAFT